MATPALVLYFLLFFSNRKGGRGCPLAKSAEFFWIFFALLAPFAVDLPPSGVTNALWGGSRLSL
jgi:hypothetical protein